MVIMLVLDCGEFVKVALTKGGVGKRVGGWVEGYGDCWGFVALVCVWVYLGCSGECLCQGFQGSGVVCSW
jgi:hypothetical protein